MSQTTKLAFRFLRELNSLDVQETFTSLGALLEYLESKEDPDPIEIQMVDNAYQALEKLKTLEGLIKRQIGASNNVGKGNTLQALYDKTPTSIGTSILD
jgi:hypothetical protein